ncbi:hypothetical protein GCM10011367_06820 [Marinicauda pacifica]|uniref:Uncharacterized protein n=1 Tax=Marinicauda pacifica TaxID=1133559 RepID=A0A4S2HEM9_9PROT|nr:DUF6768 family protein [Marinicauda pacifica]TGY94343.1 hypothetical protein E5162_03455 [Marinicauda pacifica]GGE35019.1 hypothetical protein GCM10011367_06820 [Marinicauda pacifica]
MSDLDEMIRNALDDEEQGLLHELEREPGFFERAFGTFAGPAGWANLILMVAQAVFFIAGVWFAWVFYQQDSVIEALRWGLPALVLLIVAPVLKMGLMPVMEGQKLARDIRRLELRIERLRGDQAG